MAKEEKIGALWEGEGKNGTYMWGTIGGKKVVVFKNSYKTADNRQPDWHVYPQRPRDEAPEAPPDSEVPF